MSFYSLIEALKDSRDDDDFFESLYESSNLDLSEDIYVDEGSLVDESTVVTFDGQMFPESGHAVVYAGGPGSGKGYVGGTKLAIDAKTLDVDKLKKLYIEAQKKGKFKEDETSYDLRNPVDVSNLHQRVKGLNLKNKEEAAFFNDFNLKKLPNVIYDITGDDPNKLRDLGAKLKSMGYKTTLVWVITNRQVAMIQNLSRDRVVSQKVFHEIHNTIAKNVFPFFRTGAKDYDEAWLVFNSKEATRKLSASGRKCMGNIGVVKLEKDGSGFDIPTEISELIFKTLGPLENPDNPLHYQTFDQIQQTYDLSTKEKSRSVVNDIEDGYKSLRKKVE